jgi:poly(A) polymerase
MPPNYLKAPTRRFAWEVVQRLRDAGYQALWAGGCVRDQLLGIAPSDYDVATDATPNEIREVFGKRRTLAIGAAFGVINVLGRREEGQVEVATFRCDAAYSDGRHPDEVTFSTAREDAQRRDFTINGIFFDPLNDQVIDYVGGQQDLAQGVVRAIGDPYERLAEDKLRMLRAARFTATFNFQLDETTRAAILREAHQIKVVSAERIAAELRRMLVHPHRDRAVQLLGELALLPQILPESEVLGTWNAPLQPLWQETLALLASLVEPTFRVALAALLRNIVRRRDGDLDLARQVAQRWRLSNHESEGLCWLLQHEPIIRQAAHLPWSQLQPILTAPAAPELLELAEAIARLYEDDPANIESCRAKLKLPADQLNPPVLIDGHDLTELQLPRGPLFRRILTQVRAAQLDRLISTRAEALEMARSVAASEAPTDS